jgi:hypothetical protein
MRPEAGRPPPDVRRGSRADLTRVHRPGSHGPGLRVVLPDQGLAPEPRTRPKEVAPTDKGYPATQLPADPSNQSKTGPATRSDLDLRRSSEPGQGVPDPLLGAARRICRGALVDRAGLPLEIPRKRTPSLIRTRIARVRMRRRRCARLRACLITPRVRPASAGSSGARTQGRTGRPPGYPGGRVCVGLRRPRTQQPRRSAAARCARGL